MRGIIFALLAGGFITLQGVVNSRISGDIGTWQAATVTQFTGFIAIFLVLLVMRDKGWKGFRQVKPMYLSGGTFGAIVVSTSVAAIQLIGVTVMTATFLISQLAITFAIDANGWFGVKKEQVKLPQFIGIALMIVGVLILNL
ncbi:DMT family transporter [Bacillus sp. EB01]|uniref:DMT family transporter n=1 Tax=Bacillus sp. EB01 TaxID=1347086 RepID=UPI0005C62B4F|nr:DMT family transporter [Bacillus sp. EB01]